MNISFSLFRVRNEKTEPHDSVIPFFLMLVLDGVLYVCPIFFLVLFSQS